MTINGQVNVVLANLKTLREMLATRNADDTNLNWKLSQIAMAEANIAEITQRRTGK